MRERGRRHVNFHRENPIKELLRQMNAEEMVRVGSLRLAATSGNKPKEEKGNRNKERKKQGIGDQDGNGETRRMG